MKLICLVGILGLSAVACHREEETASAGGASKRKLPVTAGEEADAVPGSKTAKASDRAKTKKPIPMAEPVPGRPGFVKSPNNGKIVDVKLIPAGTVVVDPGYPAGEEKYFRVPAVAQTVEEDNSDDGREALEAQQPPAQSVAEKPGYVINPYDKTEFDASNMEPGSVVMDPNSTPDSPRFFQIPKDHVVQQDEE